MASDGSSNPQTPVYSKARPVINEDCIGCGESNNQNFYNPATVGKTAEVLAGDEIRVDDLSDSAVDRFRVHYDPVEQLTVDLSLTVYIATIIQSLPILKGRTVDRIIADWAYSQAVVSQSLTNTGGLTVPTLADADRQYDFTGLSVTDDLNITISGDTGEGFDPESTAQDTEGVLFGNYLAYGAGTSLIDTPLAGAQSYLDAFVGLSQFEIKRSRQTNVYALGGTNEKFFVLYPKAWGEATFQKDIFIGGFVRLKNVSGVLRDTVGVGQTETDILLDNGEGHVEAFYVYETLFDNQNDPVTPIEIL